MYTLLTASGNPVVGVFRSSEWSTLEDARFQAAYARKCGRRTRIVDTALLKAAEAVNDRALLKALPDLDEQSK